MTTSSYSIWQHQVLNGWRLFWLVSGAVSVLTIIEMLRVDMSHAPDVSHMIAYSVRFAVPLIFLVVAISALPVLWPNSMTTWLLRNRRYIGLCFAVAMAWQGLFIALMSTLQREYYYEEIFFFRDELEGSTGYLFLTAMVITSFQFGRKWLTQRQWKLLHRSGMVFLWAYPFSTYWWSLYYYSNPQTDRLRVSIGWGSRPLRCASLPGARIDVIRRVRRPHAAVAIRGLGGLLIVGGLIVAATGLQWQNAVTGFLTGPAWSANLELWLPFWPFEPFLSLAAVALGVMLITRQGASRLTPQPTGA